MYASSQRLGCFLETLSRFRPDLDFIAKLNEIGGDDDYLFPGCVERGWRERRFIGSARARGRFADIAGEEWTSQLRNLMVGYCLEYGLKDFDVSITLGLDRP